MIPATIIPAGAVHEAAWLARWTEGTPSGADACETVRLPAATAGRQREFEAGRSCARGAVARLLSLPVESVVVDRSPDGAPIWPQGVIGSITHTRELAAAVAMRGIDALGIGLDAEPFMALPRAVAISRIIATSSELAPLAAATGLGQGEILTMVFSAKEATFKCLYPLVRRMFDFREASIDDIDLRTGRFILRLLVTLTPAFTCGQQFHGRIAIQGSCVFTSMHLAAVADATDDGITLCSTR